MTLKHTFCLLLCLLANLTAFSQNNYWLQAPLIPQNLQTNRQLLPLREQIYELNINQLSNILKAAPIEFETGNPSSLVQIPLPNRGLVAFSVVYSPLMENGLAAVYANYIKTYKVYNPANTSEQGRIDITPQGFHALIFTELGTVYIDPYHQKSNRFYSLYYKHDYLLPKNKNFEEEHIPKTQTSGSGLPTHGLQSFGGNLRTYRLALACTQEYAQFHGNTKILVMGAMITSINRVNSVYEKELSVRLRLINLNDTLIFLSPGPDPYSNNNGSAMLTQNQTTVDARIGTANYDIGHVYSTGGGGVAILASVCVNGQKARGVTGASQPINDPFDIDYVAHEIGHQFGGNHTFNSTTGSCGGGNRNASTAYEPGSGSTIMAYAGICMPNNTQQMSNDYFHLISLEEIRINISNGPSSSCPQITPTTNVPPTAFAPSSFVVPVRTPFMLEGRGTDSNNDNLSYCWEQYDLGASSAINVATSSGPLFRSFAPSTSPVRILPRLSLVLSGAVSGSGEALPISGRLINFRLTVRDNSPLAGAYNSQQTSLTVSGSSGPFVVRSSAVPVWTKGTWQRVNWQTAGTSQLPINCKRVCILYSRSANTGFLDTLAASVSNNGAAMVWLPDSLPSLQTRIMVRARGNIFFNISPAPITLANPAAPSFGLHTLADTLYMCGQSAAAYKLFVGRQAGFAESISLSSSGLPTGLTIAGLNTFAGPSDSLNMTINTQNIAEGFYLATIVGQAGGQSKQVSFVVAVRPTPLAAPLLGLPASGALAVDQNPNFVWQPVGTFQYDFQISADSNFSTLVYEQNNMAGPSLSLPIGLQIFTRYFWRVRTSNICGAGAWSAISSFRTFMPAPFGPFNALASAVSVNQINVSWTDFANDETGFIVEQAAPLSGFLPVDTLAANATFWAAQSLAANTIYRFRVRAFNQGGFSPYSNEVFDTTFVSTHSRSGLAATNLIISQQHQGIEIEWQNQKPVLDDVNAFLYDALGRQVARQTKKAGSSGPKMRIETGRLAAGIYILRLYSGLDIETKRLLIR